MMMMMKMIRDTSFRRINNTTLTALLLVVFVLVDGVLTMTPPVIKDGTTGSYNNDISPTINNNDSINPVIKLQSPHPDLSPSERMEELATICQQHNIDTWDVYGDFYETSGSGSSPKDNSKSGKSFLRNFELEIANEFGKDDAVFMPSGVMAQSIALLVHYSDQQSSAANTYHRQKTKTFACHPTSHLLLHEQDGYHELCGFSSRIIQPMNENDSSQEQQPQPQQSCHSSPLLYEHLKDVNLDDVSTLILELPHRELGGKVTPWEDVLQIQRHLQEKSVMFHCDGARIFEATTGYDGKTLSELAKPFDTIYISFYKGLGGLSGAMLLGSADFCQHARVWLRRFGGNLFTVLPYAVTGWAGYQRYWKLRDVLMTEGSITQQTSGMTSLPTLTFSEKKEKLVRIVKTLSDDVSFRKVASFEPSTPQVNMVHLFLRPTLEDCTKIRDNIEKQSGINIFHRLRPLNYKDKALANGFRCYMEFSMGQANGIIPDELWIESWKEFVKQASTSVKI
jgi:threonine aldolase